jgi:uncharacterized protein (TIGR03435 family)
MGSVKLLLAVVFGVVAFAQPATFEVASVKASLGRLGPDHNNQLTILPSRLTGRNVTLRLLIAEANGVQINQVVGPRWLNENEYEIEAKTESEVSRDRLRSMLLILLTQRFHLRQHMEQRTMRAYELVVDKGGPKVGLTKSGTQAASNGGYPFHGEMHELADLIAIQLTISVPADPTRPGIAGGSPPVVKDKTGLEGIYDLAIDIRPEPGADMFTLWQRYVQEHLGLRLDATRGPVPVVVVDSADRTPEAN